MVVACLGSRKRAPSVEFGFHTTHTSTGQSLGVESAEPQTPYGESLSGTLEEQS